MCHDEHVVCLVLCIYSFLTDVEGMAVHSSAQEKISGPLHQDIETLCQNNMASSCAAAHSPLLRQRQVMSLEDELHDDSDKTENADLVSQPQKSRTNDPDTYLLQSVPGSTLSGRNPKMAAGLPLNRLMKEEDVSQPTGGFTIDTVTLRRQEEETFGLDVEIFSSPLRIIISGLKPGCAAEWVRLSDLSLHQFVFCNGTKVLLKFLKFKKGFE